jgi:hypothetical protein
VGTVKMDAAAARSIADRLLEAAARLDEVHCPPMASDDLPGATVAATATPDVVADLIADLVAQMRTWATSAKASAAAVEQAGRRHAGRLDGTR